VPVAPSNAIIAARAQRRQREDQVLERTVADGGTAVGELFCTVTSESDL
jgi:hypothetical protein